MFEKECKKRHWSWSWENEDKTYYVVFSNACSILELMLCNWNLTKLVYQTLLSSDRRAWALKLSKYLKKQQHFPSKWKWHLKIFFLNLKLTVLHISFLWGNISERRRYLSEEEIYPYKGYISVRIIYPN